MTEYRNKIDQWESTSDFSFSSNIFKDDIVDYADKIGRWKIASDKITAIVKKNATSKAKKLNIPLCKLSSKIARSSDGRVKRLLKIEAHKVYNKDSAINSNSSEDPK